MQSLQYVTDKKGNKTAVQISIKEWTKIEARLKLQACNQTNDVETATEDSGLIAAMNEGATGRYVDTDTFLKELKGE